MEQGKILFTGEAGSRTIEGSAVLDRLKTKLGLIDLNSGETVAEQKFIDASEELRQAAVLVPLIARGDQVTILLTQRTAHLSSHAGQVSFPGGRVDPDDATPVAAALREAEEEVGLPPECVTIIGQLNTRITGSNFAITPIVGVLTPPFTLRPNPHEVAAIFEVTLSSVCDLRNYREESVDYKGHDAKFHVLAHDLYYIWGATARILRELALMLAMSEEELAAPA